MMNCQVILSVLLAVIYILSILGSDVLGIR